MLQIKFNNLSERFSGVMPKFLEERGITIKDGGYIVDIKTVGGNGLSVHKSGKNVEFELGRESMVFRAITLFSEHKNEEAFTCEENCWLDTCGLLYDGSQASSVLSVESCKRMLRTIAAMGYNMMMLYCEDCYEVPEVPMWGNMRPRYSQTDFKEIDDYAYSLGIEMIPCIQVLAHLKEALKKLDLRAVADTPVVLMVGCDETYKLIDNLISAVKPCFRTNRIHLNMDEAWDLGLGEYIRKNGFKSQAELMQEYLCRVMEIVNKHGLSPMMWSDMFFRPKFKSDGYYDENHEIEFNQQDRDSVPEGMQLVYWDYYHETEDVYERMIDLHNDLNGGCLFAASCRCGGTFGANYNTFAEKTARVLSLKAYMGLRLVKEYTNNNIGELEKIANIDLPILKKYMEELREVNRRYFFATYKPLGWEVLDIRYGGAEN